MLMFRYTRAAVDIVIEDIKRYCNIFKYGSIGLTFAYFGYALYSKTGNFIINAILLGLFALYTILDFVTHKKIFKPRRALAAAMRRSEEKSIKFITKTFSLGIMIYSIYVATTNVSGISIILATLMIILWVLQLLFEIVVEIFNDKKDLIVAGWNKDVENLKKPVTTVSNFIKKVKGENVVEELEEDNKEIKLLERKINKDKKKVHN